MVAQRDKKAVKRVREARKYRMLTTKEVASRYGLNILQVQRAIHLGKLKAQKWGFQWAISERDLPRRWKDLGINAAKLGKKSKP